MSVPLGGPDAGKAHTVISPILHFAGDFSDEDGNLKLSISRAWREMGVKNAIDDGSGKDDMQELLDAKEMVLVLKIDNPNVVELLSSVKGPGPEGERNFVMERNGAHATDVLNEFSVEVNWLASYHLGISYATSGVSRAIDISDAPPAKQEDSMPEANGPPQPADTPTPAPTQSQTPPSQLQQTPPDAGQSQNNDQPSDQNSQGDQSQPSGQDQSPPPDNGSQQNQPSDNSGPQTTG
jgi:hypothetical protein